MHLKYFYNSAFQPNLAWGSQRKVIAAYTEGFRSVKTLAVDWVSVELESQIKLRRYLLGFVKKKKKTWLFTEYLNTYQLSCTRILFEYV